MTAAGFRVPWPLAVAVVAYAVFCFLELLFTKPRSRDDDDYLC